MKSMETLVSLVSHIYGSSKLTLVLSYPKFNKLNPVIKIQGVGKHNSMVIASINTLIISSHYIVIIG